MVGFKMRLRDVTRSDNLDVIGSECTHINQGSPELTTNRVQLEYMKNYYDLPTKSKKKAEQFT